MSCDLAPEFGGVRELVSDDRYGEGEMEMEMVSQGSRNGRRKPKPLPSVVVAGNPAEGFEVYGPFPDPTRAVAWAERHGLDREWWVMDMHAPQEV
ncbi:MAG: hypothetical protein ACYDGR_12795 [Candidatus Dormibacteria bacterium]